MSDVKRLLAEATPLPWTFGDDEYLHGAEDLPHYGDQLNWDSEGLGGVWRNDYDKDLIVYAVNHLPDYEAAVEALERLVDQFDNYDPAGTGYTGFPIEPARAALARLRESVPA